MTDNFTKANIEAYLEKLYADDDPVRQEMEALAKERDFPIVGPLTGRHLYQLARMIQAQRVFEMGSGFGYSALYFARAVGENGRVHCTELSSDNVELAKQFLSRAGLWSRVNYHRQDALAALRQAGGAWDLIYNDIDKEYYPETVDLVYRHLRPGGLFITDNLLWSGRVLNGDESPATQGIIEFTERLFNHSGFVTTISPIRDGLAIALKTVSS